MNPRSIYLRKICRHFSLPLVWLVVFIYIGLFADTALPIDARIGDGEVTISWIKPTMNEDGTPLDDLAGYFIYRSEGPSEVFQRLNEEPVRGLCYTDTTPLNGITYFYAVTAIDFSGNESKRSPIVSATPNILPPSRLKVKPGDGEVRLFWESYEQSSLKGYYVYRRNAMDKTFQRLTDIPILETYFTDTLVANGLAYFYKVSCVGMDGIEGLHSPEVGATPMAMIPDELSSVHARYIQETYGGNRVVLTWDPSQEENIIGYRIYRRLLNEREFTLLTPEPVSGTEYTDTTIMPDQGYLYSVVAVNKSGMESQYPKEVKCFTSGIFISSFTQDTGGAAKKAADKICFCLIGEPGLTASYQVEGLTSILPMEETGEGIYNACLEVTREMSIEDGRAIGFLENQHGNRSSKAAEGILVIDNLPPGSVKNANAIWDAGMVAITWEPPEGEWTGVEIYRDVEDGSETPALDHEALPLKLVSADQSTYHDTTIKPDRTYLYHILTRDRAGNRSEPLLLPPVQIPYQTGIPFIKTVLENTAGMPQKTGDRIEVALIGEEGCQASFIILGIFETPIPLYEKNIGEYLGQYIVMPEDKCEQTFIQACLKDDLGHTNCQSTLSDLTINYESEDEIPPVIHEIYHNAFEVAGFSGDLVPGNSLDVSLKGEAGCKAFFIITSSDISPEENEAGFHKTEMTEGYDKPGLYTGTYTIRWENEAMDEARVWACLSDRAGNKVWKRSDETISVDTRPRIKVTPEDNVLWADQESQSRITVKVTDANGDPVEGHLMALTLTTTDEYTGVVGGGIFGSESSREPTIDFDKLTDLWGEVEFEYTSGFAAKTAILVAKDLTTGHAGTGYILNYIKAQTNINLLPPPTLLRMLKENPYYQLVLTADPDRLTADGVSSSWITAEILDKDGRKVENAGGVLISFSMESMQGENGSLSSSQVLTDSSGKASIRYTAGLIRGTVEITASCHSQDVFDGLTAQIKITLMSDAPAIMELTADPDELVADGDSQSQIKVWVADINKNPVQQAMVEFTIMQEGMGTLSAITEATDFNGWAECIYTTPRLSIQDPVFATILAKVTSKAPTEEELARARGTIFVPLFYPEMEEEDEVKILEWLFKKGDDVTRGTPIVRLETQKGERFILAPVSGELVKISIHRGERIRLGQTVGQILAEDSFWETD